MEKPGALASVPAASGREEAPHERGAEATSPTQFFDDEVDASHYLHGWRLHLVSLSACLCLFLVNSEVSVIGTSLVTIVKDLNGVDQMGWIVTGYLITYTSMIIIWAKASDIFGRKYTTVATVVVFTAFSGACGASQTMNQLIISRVFQGIGAAGCWSMALTIGYEMVPRERYPIQGAQYTGAGALGSLAGPLIGGGTSQHGEWRWAFLFCVPLGACTILLILATLPSAFPNQSNKNYKKASWRETLSRSSLGRLDGSGAFLLLGGTMLLVAVLLEGGVSIAWNSAASIVLFVVSGIMWILFLVNEWFFTRRKTTVEPIFPWRFVYNRAWMGTLIFSLLSGIPYNVLIINIPQRFQDVGGTSAMTAAVRLIPFNLLISFTGVIVNVVVAKTGIACLWFLLFGSIMQVGGLAWFCVLPDDGTIPSTIYGAQILTGFGIGCVLGITLLMPPLVVEKRDLAISSGALLQFRALGGVLGLSFTTTAFNNYLKTHLSDVFANASTSDLLNIAQSARQYSPAVQRRIVTTVATAYNLQMKILVAFAALQVVMIVMLYRPGNQIRVIENITPREKAATSSVVLEDRETGTA